MKKNEFIKIGYKERYEYFLQLKKRFIIFLLSSIFLFLLDFIVFLIVSTFINSFAGKAVAKTGNKPGVTKGKQWIKINKSVELLDTPGILWPKFEDKTVGLHLAFIGSINDAIIQTEELSIELIGHLKKHYSGALNERYQVDESLSDYDILVSIAKNRNFVKKGSDFDIEKASYTVIDEFRSGVLGKISLEEP